MLFISLNKNNNYLNYLFMKNTMPCLKSLKYVMPIDKDQVDYGPTTG